MLKVENLSFAYKKKNVISDINFEAKNGECVAVLGTNGAGKSTMVKCLNKILQPKKGNVFIGDENIKKISRKNIAKSIAYVGQYADISNVSVFDYVLLGRLPYIRIGYGANDNKIVKHSLMRMGIEDLALKNISELSGGQMQKVLLAKAIAQQASVLILDEPTNNLDIKSQHKMLMMVQKLVKEDNICSIIVLHDINLAFRYCTRFVFLKDGKIHADLKLDEINEKTIKEVFDIDVIIENIQGCKTIVPTYESL